MKADASLGRRTRRQAFVTPPEPPAPRAAGTAATARAAAPGPAETPRRSTRMRWSRRPRVLLKDTPLPARRKCPVFLPEVASLASTRVFPGRARSAGFYARACFRRSGLPCSLCSSPGGLPLPSPPCAFLSLCAVNSTTHLGVARQGARWQRAGALHRRLPALDGRGRRSGALDGSVRSRWLGGAGPGGWAAARRRCPAEEPRGLSAMEPETLEARISECGRDHPAPPPGNTGPGRPCCGGGAGTWGTLGVRELGCTRRGRL